MVAACANSLTDIDCRLSRLRMRILLNGNPDCSTTARFQLSRLFITRDAIAPQTSSASFLLDIGDLQSRLGSGDQWRKAIGRTQRACRGRVDAEHDDRHPEHGEDHPQRLARRL